MTTRRCEDCEAYWFESKVCDVGRCRLYPSEPVKLPSDWCLQFRARKWTAQWENDPLSIKQDVAMAVVKALVEAHAMDCEIEGFIRKWIR